MKITNHLTVVSICAAMFALLSPMVHAQTITVGTASDATEDPYTANTAGDLIYSGSSTLASESLNPSSGFADGTSGQGLNDGVINYTAGSLDGTNFFPNTTFTATFSLNTNALAGGSALGYDITSFVSVAAWNSERADQNYQLLVSYVGASGTFFSLGNFSVVDPGGAPATGTEATQLTLTQAGGGVLDNGGVLATGVAAIEFVDLGNVPAVGNFDPVWQEIQAYGTATAAPSEAPEPSTRGLLLGSLLLAAVALGYRRRFAS